MGAMSPWHWAVLAIVVILLFGAKKLPDAARSLGKSMRIFKSEIKEMQAESGKSDSDEPRTEARERPTPIDSERIDSPSPVGEQDRRTA